MEENKLSAILILLVPQVVALIVENDGLSELEATEALYHSALYTALEEEETKLWHLSPKALYELYRQEMETGHIEFPEEA